MHIGNSLTCDLLIVGSGLAGLRAAVDAVRSGMDVLLVSKGELCSGGSFYPLTGGLGAQLPIDAQDAPVYLQELLDVGDGVADPRLYRIMVQEIPKEIDRISDLGITTHEVSGRPACFAARERRLAVWSGWDGIRDRVSEKFSRMKNLCILHHCDLLRLVKREGRIAGALLCDGSSDIIQVRTPAVLLATGGYSGLYTHNLTTADACGTGHSIALDAGAVLTNVEFIQFIPGLMKPVYKLLFGEISLWHCADVTDGSGNHVVHDRLPGNISFAQCIAARSLHGPFTTRDISKYFDISMMEQCIAQHDGEGFTITYLPSIADDTNELVASVRKLYRDHGIDLAAQGISIAPFAHCANGGILIDEDGCTGVPGLFAAGEAAGGVHGADRQGGTATAACLVFGARAAAKAIGYASSHACTEVPPQEILMEFASWIGPGGGSTRSARRVLRELGDILWYEAGVVRNDRSLRSALDRVTGMRSAYQPITDTLRGVELRTAMQAFHALRTSEAILRAMLCRTESRGGHYRSDFPERDDRLQGKQIMVSEHSGKIDVGFGEKSG